MKTKNKKARDLEVGEVTAVAGSLRGHWFVKYWTVETVTDHPEFGYTEIRLTFHSAADEFLRIDPREDLVVEVKHKDELYELFPIYEKA